MPIIQLPNHCGHKSVIGVLAEAELLAEPPEKIAIHFPDSSFVYPSAIGFLAAWGLFQRQQRGTRLVITGDDNSRRYLSRMDLLAALESPFTEDFQRKPAAGRFLPVTLVGDTMSAKYAVDSICDLVLHQLENARDFLPALEMVVTWLPPPIGPLGSSDMAERLVNQITTASMLDESLSRFLCDQRQSAEESLSYFAWPWDSLLSQRGYFSKC